MQRHDPEHGHVLTVRIKPGMMRHLDAFRREQLDPPTRSRAIVMLLEIALGELRQRQEAAE